MQYDEMEDMLFSLSGWNFLKLWAFVYPENSTDKQTNHLIMLNNKSGDRDVDKFPSFTRYFVAPDCRRLSQKDLRNNLLYYGCVNINLLWHYTASILWMWLRLELQLRLMGRRSVRCVRHVIRLDTARRGEIMLQKLWKSKRKRVLEWS